MDHRTFVKTAGLVPVSSTLGTLSAQSAAFSHAGVHAASPGEVRLDYAYYSPTSLVLKRFGRLEEDLKKDNTGVKLAFPAAGTQCHSRIAERLHVI